MAFESEPPRADEAAGALDSSSCVVADDGQDHKLARSRVQAGPRGGAFEAWVDAARQVRPQDELARRGLWPRSMAGDNGVPCPGCGGRDRFDARRIFEETARSCLDALEHALDLAKPTSRMKGSIAVKIVAVVPAEAAE